MTRHLNLLASAPKPAPRIAGLPASLAPALLALLALVAGGLAFWARDTTAALDKDLQAARRAATQAESAAAGRLDATVLAALRLQVQERETQAAALAGDPDARRSQAPASQWLTALDEAGVAGIAVNQVRIEPGPRLTLSGSALQAGDVHAFLARLQKQPLAGTAAIGQLEIRRGESDASPLSFRLTPPAPDRLQASAAVVDDDRSRR